MVDALIKIYNLPKEEREELGKKGREHVMKNYNFEDFCKSWEETLTTVYKEMGSWDTRQGYKTWELKEL